MKRSVFTIIFLVLLSIASFAQNVSSHCYRGFVDAGYTFGIPYNGDYAIDGIEINTSHGYQISPYFFVGGGAGIHYKFAFKNLIDKRDPKIDIPIFANVRVNFMKTKVAPFIDIKAGTFINENWGHYVNASAGCRIAFNTKNAMNVLLGFLSEDLTFKDVGILSNGGTSSNYILGMTLKVGYEF